jgi:hypothetical protein
MGDENNKKLFLDEDGVKRLAVHNIKYTNKYVNEYVTNKIEIITGAGVYANNSTDLHDTLTPRKFSLTNGNTEYIIYPESHAKYIYYGDEISSVSNTVYDEIESIKNDYSLNTHTHDDLYTKIDTASDFEPYKIYEPIKEKNYSTIWGCGIYKIFTVKPTCVNSFFIFDFLIKSNNYHTGDRDEEYSNILKLDTLYKLRIKCDANDTGEFAVPEVKLTYDKINNVVIKAYVTQEEDKSYIISVYLSSVDNHSPLLFYRKNIYNYDGEFILDFTEEIIDNYPENYITRTFGSVDTSVLSNKIIVADVDSDPIYLKFPDVLESHIDNYAEIITSGGGNINGFLEFNGNGGIRPHTNMGYVGDENHIFYESYINYIHCARLMLTSESQPTKTTYNANVKATILTANRTYTLPDETGTIALQEYVSSKYLPLDKPQGCGYYYSIDLSDEETYDPSLYYPVVGHLSHDTFNHVIVRCGKDTDDSGTVSWSTHSTKYITLNMDIIFKSPNWGWTDGEAICLDRSYKFVDSPEGCPVGFECYGTSDAVLWLRGGCKYHSYTDYFISWNIVSDSYTLSNKSVLSPSSKNIFKVSAVKLSTIYANFYGNSLTLVNDGSGDLNDKYTGVLKCSALTGSRTYTLPDESGNIALYERTSDYRYYVQYSQGTGNAIHRMFTLTAPATYQAFSFDFMLKSRYDRQGETYEINMLSTTDSDTGIVIPSDVTLTSDGNNYYKVVIYITQQDDGTHLLNVYCTVREWSSVNLFRKTRLGHKEEKYNPVFDFSGGDETATYPEEYVSKVTCGTRTTYLVANKANTATNATNASVAAKVTNRIDLANAYSSDYTCHGTTSQAKLWLTTGTKAGIASNDSGGLLIAANWSSNVYNAELFVGMGNYPNIYYRGKNNGTYTSWKRIIDSSGAAFYGDVSINTESDTKLTIKNTAGGDSSLILHRGDNTDWRIINSAGNLYFQADYQTTTYYNCAYLTYSAGSLWVKGNIEAGSYFTGSFYVAKTSAAPTAGKLAALATGTSRLYSNALYISNPTTTNDQGWIRVTGTGESDTVLEIATGDDGGNGETIVARQYNTSNAVAHEITLLNNYGYTKLNRLITDLIVSSNWGDITGSAYCICFGKNSKTTADYATAIGPDNTVSNDSSIAIGYGNTVSSTYSAAIGSHNTVGDQTCAYAIGLSCSANYSNSMAIGMSITTPNVYCLASGKNNATTTTKFFVIGKGTSSSARSNAFSVSSAGTVCAASTITASTTADYAEYFEWADGNPDNEDRVGYFVTFDDQNMIRIANKDDDYILGVVSGEPFVLGNGDCDVWNGMYLHDEFRRTLYEPRPKIDIEVDEETGEPIEKQVYDEDGNIVYEGKQEILNPEYDNTKEYIARADRPEWGAVGMLGVLAVRHDGTLKLNGYATVGENGIATACERTDMNSYRVIHFNAPNVAEIVFR